MLFTFIEVKLYPPSSIIRSAIHQVVTHLTFMQISCDMWLWGVDQLVLWVFYTGKKTIQQHFILHVTTLETWHNQYWHWTWQTTHVIIAIGVVHLHNIETIKDPSPLTTPHWEVENLWLRSLDQQLPQLEFQHFQILWS